MQLAAAALGPLFQLSLSLDAASPVLPGMYRLGPHDKRQFPFWKADLRLFYRYLLAFFVHALSCQHVLLLQLLFASGRQPGVSAIACLCQTTYLFKVREQCGTLCIICHPTCLNCKGQLQSSLRRFVIEFFLTAGPGNVSAFDCADPILLLPYLYTSLDPIRIAREVLRSSSVLGRNWGHATTRGRPG